MKKLTILLFTLLFTSSGFAQYFDQEKTRETPKILFTGGSGYFYIAMENFSQVYEKNSGMTVNGDIGIKLLSLGQGTGLYATAAYQRFKKKGNMVNMDDYSSTKYSIDFTLTTIDYGVRYCWTGNSKTRMWWIGGGVSQAAAQEDCAFLSYSTNGKGLYFESGTLLSKSGAFITTINIKYSFALVDGRGGIGGDTPNVGGLSIIAGLGIQL